MGGKKLRTSKGEGDHSALELQMARRELKRFTGGEGERQNAAEGTGKVVEDKQDLCSRAATERGCVCGT